MSSTQRRVLVVDDAATVRMYHRNILEGAGYLVDEAINGIEALEKALTSEYDLMLVDINMPKRDGYAFLQELRSQSVHQPPAIMISTESQESDRQLAYLSGANFYLNKPIKPNDLLEYCALLLGSGEGL
jgi:two-component system, chemotaxis family, chemotaxis protein CheY